MIISGGIYIGVPTPLVAVLSISSLLTTLAVPKSVSFALREIGRIGVAERDRAVALASELVADGTKTQRWIGKNALKELENMKYDKELSRDFNGIITKELIAVK